MWAKQSVKISHGQKLRTFERARLSVSGRISFNSPHYPPQTFAFLKEKKIIRQARQPAIAKVLGLNYRMKGATYS